MTIDQGKLKELLTDHQTGHSEFQDDYLITWRHGGTVYGQYKQALRELYRRFRGLREMDFDRQKSEIETRKSQHEKREYFDAELAAIEHKRKIMQLEELERSYTNTKREFIRFYQQAVHLKKQIGILDPEKRRKLDREMWIHRTKVIVALDLLTIGRLSKNAYELLGALPRDMKKPVIEFIENKDIRSIREWYLIQGNESDFEQLPSGEVSDDLEIEYIENAYQLTTI